MLPFRVRARDRDRTSHYLIHLARSPLAFRIMKDVMDQRVLVRRRTAARSASFRAASCEVRGVCSTQIRTTLRADVLSELQRGTEAGGVCSRRIGHRGRPTCSRRGSTRSCCWRWKRRGASSSATPRPGRRCRRRIRRKRKGRPTLGARYELRSRYLKRAYAARRETFGQARTKSLDHRCASAEARTKEVQKSLTRRGLRRPTSAAARAQRGRRARQPRPASRSTPVAEVRSRARPRSRGPRRRRAARAAVGATRLRAEDGCATLAPHGGVLASIQRSARSEARGNIARSSLISGHASTSCFKRVRGSCRSRIHCSSTGFAVFQRSSPDRAPDPVPRCRAASLQQHELRLHFHGE